LKDRMKRCVAIAIALTTLFAASVERAV